MKSCLAILSFFIVMGLGAQEKVLKNLDSESKKYEAIALKIWDWAEVGYQEVQSSALLQETLSEAGFRIEKGVAGIPTAFVAEYGSGTPIIGILGEYDALPGLSQKAVPKKKVRKVLRAMPMATTFSVRLQLQRPSLLKTGWRGVVDREPFAFMDARPKKADREKYI